MGGSRSAGCLALRGEGSLADGLAHLGRCTRSGRLPAMAPAALKDARPGPLDAAQDWGGRGAGPWGLPWPWPSVCWTPRREAALGMDPSQDPVSQSDLCYPVADLVFLGFRDS